MFGIGRVNTPIKPCTKELFMEAISSRKTLDTCSLIARMESRLDGDVDAGTRDWLKDSIQKAKKELPCITPLAWFDDNKRSIKNAHPSGLNMLDIDHVKNPQELWESIKDKKVCKGRMALVHKTPSTHGLRLIFTNPEGMTIEDGQAWMAKELDLKEYDTCTKDLARCSFLVPKDYIYYYDENKLWEDPLRLPLKGEEKNGNENENKNENKNKKEEAESEAVVGGGEKAEKETVAGTDSGGEEHSVGVRQFPSSFKNIPYSDIIKQILFTAGYDDEPAEGERNNALYLLARNLRYLCDFDVQFVMSVLPDWGLPKTEVEHTVMSAVKSVRKQFIPSPLESIIQGLKRQNATFEEQGYDAIWDWKVQPSGVLADIVNQYPEYVRNAAYFTAMTCFATLLSPLRGHGMNDDTLALNFETTISAPQAVGKGFMRKVYEQVLAPMIEEDNRQRKIQNKIEQENKRKSGDEDYEPQEFEGCIRGLMPSTSTRVLLERLDKAKGKHCMMMAPEIDAMTKAEKAGKWSEKSDIFRNAYDNDLWGTDYASENSYHAYLPVYLNLLLSGTPVAVKRFFNDVENGLVTRFLFIDIPPNLGAKRPKSIIVDEDIKSKIRTKVDYLYECMEKPDTDDGLIWMDTKQMVEDTDRLYDEEERYAYLCNQSDPSREIARRRYADYCVKFMMIETYLNDGVYTEEIRDRCIAATKYATEMLLAHYGDEINESYKAVDEYTEEAKRRLVKKNLLSNLDSTFTVKDYIVSAQSLGVKERTARKQLERLVENKYLKRLDRGVYSKI